MQYDFSQLSPVDFEDLCRDLIGKELDIRFEAFGPGPDGGIDGRHAKAGQPLTILQVKHYMNSPTLKYAMQKERAKIDRLNLMGRGRYILATSKSLTPAQKGILADIIGDHLKSTADIYGCEDLNGLLREFPDIEKSHTKLWISSTPVLERVLNAGIEVFSEATKNEVLTKLKTYVPNPSLHEARKLLHENHVLIVSGYAGVGKTTLAEMLAYEFLAHEWKFVAIRSLDEGFAKIDDKVKAVFFFDDFLGRIELNKQALHQHESALSKFVERVRKSPNARFILTTREHIFREAGVISDYIEEQPVQLSKYVLDVGVYTRHMKARILFNHLAVSNLSDEHFKVLVDSQSLPEIIDHKNYNPRIVSFVSSELTGAAVSPEQYLQFILEALDNPERIWEKPFSKLAANCQHLLIVLFFSSEYGESIADLQVQYEAAHKVLCREYQKPIEPSDFEISLKILETGFVNISGKRVSYVNPGLRDYMKAYLNKPSLLRILPNCTTKTSWALALWKYARGIVGAEHEQKQFAEFFCGYAQQIQAQIATKSLPRYSWDTYSHLNIPNQIKLFMEWWRITKLDVFAKTILALCCYDSGESNDWGRGLSIPELMQEIHECRNDGFLSADKAVSALSQKLIYFLEDMMFTDDLVELKDNISLYLDIPAPIDLIKHKIDNVPNIVNGYDSTSESEEIVCSIREALENAIKNQIDDVFDIISAYSSVSELEEHIDHLESLGDFSVHSVDSAIDIVKEKIEELMSEHDEDNLPDDYPKASERNDPSEDFNDASIQSLFSTLIKS